MKMVGMIVMAPPMAFWQLHAVCAALNMHKYEVEAEYELRNPNTNRSVCTIHEIVDERSSFHSSSKGVVFNKEGGEDLLLSPKLRSMTAINLDPAIPILTVCMPPVGTNADVRIMRERRRELKADIDEIKSHWTRCKLNTIYV